MPGVFFVTADRRGPATAGETLHMAVRGLGHVMELSCGGTARCTSCCVLVSEGEEALTPPGADEMAELVRNGLAPPWRLSCQARLLDSEAEVVLVAC